MERYNAYRDDQQKKPHTPGTWVIYFGLAAVPLFILGQSLIATDDSARRRATFLQMAAFVGSGLGLLVTTSLLGLRKYLQDRGAKIPPAMTAGWLGMGAMLIVSFLVIGAVLPRPHSETPLVNIGKIGKQDRKASKYAMKKDDSAGKGEGAAGEKKEAGDGKGNAKGGKEGGNAGQKGGGGGKGKDQGGKQSDQQGKQGDKQSDQKGKQGDDPQKKDGPNAKQGDGAEKKGNSEEGKDSGDKADGDSNDGSDGQESSSPSKLGEVLEKISSGVKWIVWIVVAIAVIVGIVIFFLKFLAPFTSSGARPARLAEELVRQEEGASPGRRQGSGRGGRGRAVRPTVRFVHESVPGRHFFVATGRGVGRVHVQCPRKLGGGPRGGAIAGGDGP